jgi:lysophospholipase L1-like esterase
MIRASREARVPTVFVHIPPNTLDEFPALAAHMRKAGALFVDPLEAMKAHGGTLYFERDMHMNEAGHRLVAAEVAAFLRSHPEALKH